MSRDTLNQLLAILNDYDPQQDSYDLALWPEMSPSERTQAEDALIAAATDGDPRALVTIGHLRLERALPVVRTQAQNPHPWVRFAAHRAIRGLVGEVDGLVEDGASDSWMIRLGAIRELVQVAGQMAESAIRNALDDADALVRSSALDGLIERHGLIELTCDSAGKSALESPLKTLDTLLASEVAPLWQQAAGEAYRIFSALAGGSSPDELGLRYKQSAPDGFRGSVTDAFFNMTHPFDVGPIAAQDGHDRHWAEAFLALQLKFAPEERARRAVSALAQLNARWVMPALATSAHGYGSDDPYALAVAQAIQALST
jgi:hypothetical protein